MTESFLSKQNPAKRHQLPATEIDLPLYPITCSEIDENEKYHVKQMNINSGST